MNNIIENKKLALVVDDSKAQRLFLSLLLKEEGYRVITANNGAQGVEMYIESSPDLVLMDINMPVMDGYEATRRIKRLSQAHIAPLIFITSLDNEQVYIDSIDAGGDGILVRPFSPVVFKAKIKATQRINDLYQQVKDLQQEQQHDAELAEKMVTQLIDNKNFARNKIGIYKKAAALFSGDIQLTALSPSGEVHILLGDFTGHGLRASIGAIPITETFRAMTRKGFSIFEIIAQLNSQLKKLLPTDLFFAAGFVSINGFEQSISVFNAGLPDAYILDENGDVKRTFCSSHPPLGILPKILPHSELEVVAIDKGHHILLISDGIIEARNEKGEMYGVERLEVAAKYGIQKKDMVNVVADSLTGFCGNMPQEDDISLINIPCDGWENEIHSNKIATEQDTMPFDREYINAKSAMSWNMKLSGKSLAEINPIPLMMNPMQEIESTTAQRDSLYTILTELFINSLDHGVLGLSSELKNSAEGFTQYFNERAKRLSVIHNGSVNINIQYFPLVAGGKIIINIKDSGDGFNIIDAFSHVKPTEEQTLALSGRGIVLVDQMCDTLEYKDNGTAVEATYIWHHK